jgi:hypothetical protein
MFIVNLKKFIALGAVLTSLMAFSPIASAQQFELNRFKSMQKSHQQQAISPSFSARKSGTNKITAHCWTIAECNEMISDCISVGGHFRHGITDHNTGATSEGSCTL